MVQTDSSAESEICDSWGLKMRQNGCKCRQASSAELLRAVGNDDPLAWAELVGRYTGTVRSVIAEFRLQQADAADVAQNTWLRLYLHAGTIRDPAKLGGWLATTAKREALALIRRARPEVTSEWVGEDVAAPTPSPEEAAITAETRDWVRAAADELSDRQKVLVDELFYQPQRSYKEVAQRTGLPVGSIGPTRGRMLRELHRRLSTQPRCEGADGPCDSEPEDLVA